MSTKIIVGDCRDVLKTLADRSVQMVCTSPPYFGLRSYLPADHPDKALEIGGEQTPDEYVKKLVSVFHEARRVLRDDGTLWVNIGDSYASNNGSNGTRSKSTLEGGRDTQKVARSAGVPRGLKPKDLIGIPWMLAFALRADGWWLRSDNVWGKPNGMPESATDRPTRAHEYVFLLSKSDRYYYDQEAVRTAPKAVTQTQLAKPYLGQSTKPHEANGVQNASDIKRRIVDKQRGHSRRHEGFNARWDAMEKADQIAHGGNLRSVWWISPAQCSEAHFAVMPNRVAEICIRAGSRVGDTIMDPFGGAGTTGLVADQLQRNAVLIELYDKNTEIGARRVTKDAGLFARVERG